MPDYVEAATRSGHPAEARVAAETLTALTGHTSSPWLAGLAERVRALLADHATAEQHYAASIAHLSAADAAGDLARTHLLYGEWLRRRRRRRDAREHLAAAVRSFDASGARPFADRARHEYAATGETLPPPASAADLTPQEALVAELASAGKTNPEIAAALFVSPSTVDYHLRKVYRKLGIASRRQLRDRRV